MNKHHHPARYLNRIATTYNCNPFKANPLQVLHDFFSYATPGEHFIAFDAFCIAALQERYSWQRGSPANALHYSKQLELLIEAAYLINLNPKKYRTLKQRSTINVQELPVLLTADEYKNPCSFIELFFKRAALSVWKKRLAAFTTATLAADAVTDEISAAEVFECIHYIKKLVGIAARII